MSRRRSITRDRIKRSKRARPLRREELIVSPSRKVSSVRGQPRSSDRFDSYRPGLFLERKLQFERLPILGLRSQRERKKERDGFRKDLVFIGDKAPKTDPLYRGRICRRRKQRRARLFQIGIAGRNKRLSPGVGGTYRRTPESEVKC